MKTQSEKKIRLIFLLLASLFFNPSLASGQDTTGIGQTIFPNSTDLAWLVNNLGNTERDDSKISERLFRAYHEYDYMIIGTLKSERDKKATKVKVRYLWSSSKGYYYRMILIYRDSELSAEYGTPQMVKAFDSEWDKEKDMIPTLGNWNFHEPEATSLTNAFITRDEKYIVTHRLSGENHYTTIEYNNEELNKLAEEKRASEPKFEPGEFKTIKIGLDVEFEGPALWDGTPHGQIKATYSPLGVSGDYTFDLLVDSGKVVNKPDEYYLLKFNEELTYQGRLDPETWSPQGLGVWTYGAPGSRVGIESTFDAYKNPEEDSEVVLTLQNKSFGYPQGQLILQNVNELEMCNCFSFDADATYYPDSLEDVRFVGRFTQAYINHTENRAERSLALPIGRHTKEKKINGEWIKQSETLYVTNTGEIDGEDYYGIEKKYKALSSRYLTLSILGKFSSDEGYEWRTKFKRIIDYLEDDGQKLINTKTFTPPTDNILGFMKSRNELRTKANYPTVFLPNSIGLINKIAENGKKYFETYYIYPFKSDATELSMEYNRIITELLKSIPYTDSGEGWRVYRMNGKYDRQGSEFIYSGVRYRIYNRQSKMEINTYSYNKNGQSQITFYFDNHQILR